MKIKPEQLKSQLEKDIKPIYFAFGKETLLVEQTLENIKNFLLKKDFTEKICFYVEPAFNWDTVFNENYSISLFANKRIIEIRLNNSNINTKDAQAISEIVNNLQENIVIIICANKLSMPQKNSKWFKGINEKGVIIEHWDITNYQLPMWISTNMKDAGLMADKEVINAISHSTEGNLLASMQEIKKLKLAYPDGKINKQEYLQEIYAQYDYSVFGLIDTALIGDVNKVNKIFNSLIKKDTLMLFITNALYKELKSLMKMALELKDKQTMQAVLANNNVWQKRQPFIKKALNNHSYKDIQKLILSLGRIDRSIKGVDNLNVNDAIRNILIRLCGFNKWNQ